MPSGMIEQTISNITEMELNAEHMAQLALEKTLDTTRIPGCAEQSNIECSLSNLIIYFQSLDNISSIEPLLSETAQLLTAIYQDEESVQLALMTNPTLTEGASA